MWAHHQHIGRLFLGQYPLATSNPHNFSLIKCLLNENGEWSPPTNKNRYNIGGNCNLIPFWIKSLYDVFQVDIKSYFYITRHELDFPNEVFYHSHVMFQTTQTKIPIVYSHMFWKNPICKKLNHVQYIWPTTKIYQTIAHYQGKNGEAR